MSPPRLTPELLARPAPWSARCVARMRLDIVEGALDRLNAEDEDALHRLRVSLRRLRSWLAAYRPFLDDTLKRKTRRRLAALARATNPARDAEVALLWILSLDDLQPGARRGREHLAHLLREELDRCRRAVVDQIGRELPDVIRDLREQTSFYRARVSLDRGLREKGMAAVTGRLLRRQAGRFSRALHRVGSAADFEEAHQSRIEGKRLRYLLEPLDGDERAARAVARLTELQDQLGDFRDKRLLADRIVREIEGSAGQDARRQVPALSGTEEAAAIPAARGRSVRTGLIEIARRAGEREREAFLAFEKSWSGPGSDAVLNDVEAIADDLRLIPLGDIAREPDSHRGK